MRCRPQHPQHRQLRIGAQLTQSLVAQRDHHDGVRVGGVGLAALAGIEDPGPGGELGRHIQHLFPVGQEPLGERAADPVRASTAQIRSGHCRAICSS